MSDEWSRGRERQRIHQLLPGCSGSSLPLGSMDENVSEPPASTLSLVLGPRNLVARPRQERWQLHVECFMRNEGFLKDSGTINNSLGTVDRSS